ncbi:Ferredoxin fas2 [bacterium HR29]|nr:Ferredoxin fas2 [bacterium HR29]
MRVVVDPDLCEGNRKCELAAPEVFRVGEDELARVLIERPPEELRAKVEQAARLCPRQAIRLFED